VTYEAEISPESGLGETGPEPEHGAVPHEGIGSNWIIAGLAIVGIGMIPVIGYIRLTQT
jgi:hypothetical protein